MDIILVHLGPNVPSYLFQCIEQIRNVTDNRIILVLSQEPEFTLRTANVITVHVDKIPKCANWADFRSNHFNGMGLSLWRYACERFYAIETVMEYLGVKKALHIENDNLIYSTPDWEFLDSYVGTGIGLTQITETMLGAGVMYIGSLNVLGLMNLKLNNLIALGSDELMKRYGAEMLHEMRLLKIVQDENADLMKLFPIFPDANSRFVYDCASWGQYVGGTFHTPGESYHDDSHLIGREINKGKFTVQWADENGQRFPMVLDIESAATKRLFNLHIHSKQLERWMSK